MNRWMRTISAGLLLLWLAASAPGRMAAQVADPNTYLDLSTFARGTTGDLVMYHWNRLASAWEPANLSANRGTAYRIVGNPSAVNSFRRDAAGAWYTRPDVFARNAEGALLDFFWTPAQGWDAKNRTTDTAGGRFLSDPVAVVSTPDMPGASVTHVFGRGRVFRNGVWVSGRLLHYWWIEGAAWEWEDLTGDFGGPTIYGTPDVVLTGYGDRVRIDVFARGGQSELLRYWWTPQSGWNRQGWDLTLATGGLPITGDFDAVHSTNSGENAVSATRLDVYGLRLNELVHYYTVDFDTWYWEPLSANLGGAILFGGLDVVVSSEWGQLRHDVAVRRSPDQLMRYTWTAAWGWRPFPVAAPTVKADPVYVRRFRHGVKAFDVFARGTVAAGAGDLIHLFQGPDPTSATGLENLTSAIPGERFVGQPSVAPGTLEVFARSSSGHLLRYWYEPNNLAWKARNLTIDWAGLPIASDPVILQWLFEPPQ